MYPHRIRLRGPWQREPTQSGHIRCRRRFGAPRRLDAFERLWLVFDAVAGPADIRLNGAALGSHAAGPIALEVTSHIRDRNELVLEVECDAEVATPWGEAALEVRCQAYLTDIRFRAEAGRVHVSGAVAGTADQALDLYLLVGRSTAAYATVKPAGAPHLFALASSDTYHAGPHAARVELVHAATVWYVAEAEVLIEA